MDTNITLDLLTLEDLLDVGRRELELRREAQAEGARIAQEKADAAAALNRENYHKALRALFPTALHPFITRLQEDPPIYSWFHVALNIDGLAPIEVGVHWHGDTATTNGDKPISVCHAIMEDTWEDTGYENYQVSGKAVRWNATKDEIQFFTWDDLPVALAWAAEQGAEYRRMTQEAAEITARMAAEREARARSCEEAAARRREEAAEQMAAEVFDGAAPEPTLAEQLADLVRQIVRDELATSGMY